ncbi:hypothetical protein GDO86_017072 [Hymenochirus boettgeri]|uniref:CASP8 and FADD-like apoptosis regulator n=1 Tax=Hymenochirus boettgeri TaxID=247094 RepID=A0A8T2IM44_9PIPI|nr:hypothetical protein GDO86_017072 [Hymenochirus boettgeri]
MQPRQSTFPINKVTSPNAWQRVPINALLQISEDIDPAEVEAIRYLCRDVLFKTNIRELLNDLDDPSLNLPFSLAEVLYVVKRFDLLKYLHKSKTEAENGLKLLSDIQLRYRILMIEIGEQLEGSDLESLIFLLKDKLRTGGKLSNKTFLSLITELEKLNLIAPQRLDLIEQCLQNIHRIDLKKRITNFRLTASCDHYSNAFGAQPSSQALISPQGPRNEINFHKDTVPIQETGEPYPMELREECYTVRKATAGFCLIIDCVGNDADYLKDIFVKLNFTVKCSMYTTMNTFKETLQLVANMEQLRSHDIFVCIIISRGSSDSVFCIDKSFPGFPLDKVKNFFTGHSCPHLVGKPKLFFVQNYIVQKIEESGDMIEVDGPVYASFVNEQTAQRNPKVPIEADIFWSHCKVNEIFLLESPNSPSLYFKHLSQLLSDEQKR